SSYDTFRAWAYGVVNDLRTPINKDGYRILVLVAVLVTLSGATLGFIFVDQSWKCALVCAMFSLPAGLFVGMLMILSRRRQRAAGPRDMRQVITSCAILV